MPESTRREYGVRGADGKVTPVPSLPLAQSLAEADPNTEPVAHEVIVTPWQPVSRA